MGNKKRKRLILPRLLAVLLLIYVSIMLSLKLYITPKGVVHRMGGCEECILTAESNKKLMNETYAKLIYYPELIRKYGYNSELSIDDISKIIKIYKELDLDWNKLFSSNLSTDIQIKYEEKYSYEELKRGPLTLEMIDAFIITGRGGCRYTFEVDHSDMSSYRLKLNWRDVVATITPDGVEREYFIRFPDMIEKWLN